MTIDQYIQRYGRRLYGLCRVLCPHRYDPGRALEPWLAKICVNTHRSALRRLARSPLLDFASGQDKDRLLDSIPAPEGKDYLPLYEAVGQLPDKLRQAVALFYFQGMDLAAAAQTLGIPVGTMKSRLNNARKLLKEALADETDLRF